MTTPITLDDAPAEPAAAAEQMLPAARRNAGGGNGNRGGGNGTGANGTAPAGNVRPTDIIEEMQVAYLDYAMSVIVARALPDVRDGLKPVHRRILYAMWHDLGLTHDKPHKKSARIVGEVLGKYHPHGDTAVYDAMVRMAQPFSLRYPLVDGQGNFGSVDGDNAAAMRYTEARLAGLSNLMLEDLEKETVGWQFNFDNTLREPAVLPAALPNLLINGSSGIAVGMATNIPPHNLGEVVDALAYMIDRFDHIEDVSVEDLLHFIKGPDFPTGGIVYRFRDEGKAAGAGSTSGASSTAGASGVAGAGDVNEDGHVDVIAQGYSTGRARLVMQAKVHFEELARARMRIVVTELPYQTNKTTLLERIADLVRDGKIEGIGDLRDESDRTGMRICIELKRDVEPKSVLADLFKYTPLQQTFGMQLLALVGGQPKLLTLKRMLQHFVQHRQEIIRRRSEFDLARARERQHIVEGLLKALDILDEVIATIRRSQTVETARKNLIANFKFSEVQAQAILEMQLRRLAALERKKLQEEHEELRKRIAWLQELLASPQKVLDLIKGDLLAIKEQYADTRRTQIVDLTKGTHTTHDLLPEIDVWVSASSDGTLRRQTVGRQSASLIRQIGRNADAALLQGNTRDLLYLFTSGGRTARIGIHEVPEEGKTFSELGLFSRNEKLVAALPLPRTNGAPPDGHLFLATERGVVKRLLLADLTASTTGAIAVIKVEEKDKLGWAFQTRGDQEILLVTSSGQAIRFAEDEVRSMGSAAAGVGGIKLDKNERVIHAAAVDGAGLLVTFTTAGFAKCTALGEYPRQGRNGGGVVAHKLTARTGELSAATLLPAALAPRRLLLVAGKGTPRVQELAEIPQMARAAQGKQLLEASGPPVNAIRWVPGDEGNEPSSPTPPRLMDPPPAAAKPAAPAKSAAPAKPAAGAGAHEGEAVESRRSPAAAKGAPAAAMDAPAPVRTKPGTEPKAEPRPTPVLPARQSDVAPVRPPAISEAKPEAGPRPKAGVKLKVQPPVPSLQAAADAGKASAAEREGAAGPMTPPLQKPVPQETPAQKPPARKGPATQGDKRALQPGLFAEAEPPAAEPPAKRGKPDKASKIKAVTSVDKRP